MATSWGEVDVEVGAGLVDEGARGRPVGVVEHGPVQRLEDALEGVVQVHAALTLSEPHISAELRRRQ